MGGLKEYGKASPIVESRMSLFVSVAEKLNFAEKNTGQ